VAQVVDLQVGWALKVLRPKGYPGPRPAPLHPDGATHRPGLARGMGGELGHVNLFLKLL
jgi:hypothetical protein